MKLLTGLVVLSAVFAVGRTQSSSGTCTAAEQTAFVSNELGTTCGLNLGAVDPSNPLGLLEANITARSANLNGVCTGECGGALNRWLSTCCNDQAGAFGIMAWCTPTGVDMAGRDQCYFNLPPVFNQTNPEANALCAAANETNPCPTGCAQVLQGLAAALGCCFQSFYNDSAFIQAQLAAGTISDEEAQELAGFTNALLWQACQVEIPSECTSDFSQVFPRATNDNPIDVAEECPGGDGAASTINPLPLVSLVMLLLSVLAFL